MEHKITEILEDLYKIDPEFKKHEEKLVPIIKTILEAKPDTKINENFAKNLRVHLVEMAESKKIINESKNSFKFFTWKVPYFLTGALTAVLLIIVVLGSPFKFGINKSASTNKLFSNTITINETTDRAFGTLPMMTPNLSSGDKGGGGGEIVMEERGGGQAATKSTTENTVPQEKSATQDVAAAPSSGITNSGDNPIFSVPFPAKPTTIEPQPEPLPVVISPQISHSEYIFKYTGEKITLGNKKVDVLKRGKNVESRKSILAWLNGLNLGLLDLSGFKNAYVQNITVSEDRDYGYTISVDLDQETISISQNWAKWPQCVDDNCFRLKAAWNKDPKNIRSDADLLKAASDFMVQHKIDTSIYDKPEVDHGWKIEYDLAIKKTQELFIPESFNVRYPLLINGAPVYYDTGTRYGLELAVDARELKVIGAWNLSSQNYESSKYEAITDPKEIIALAEKGGWQPIPIFNEPNKKITLNLGTPQKVFIKTWIYKNNNSTAEEVLVPAFSFPITNPPESLKELSRKSIIVPLVREILNNNTPQAVTTETTTTIVPQNGQ